MGNSTKSGAKNIPNVSKKRQDGKPISNGSKGPGNAAGLNVPTKHTVFTASPPSWPTDLPYLHTPLPHSNLTEVHHNVWHPSTPPPATAYTVPNLVTYTPSANPLVQIRQITDPAHPAYKQHGLFAARHLAPGTHIVDYTGLLHVCPLPSPSATSSEKAESSPCATSDYDLAFLDRDAALAIDGTTMGNESRFVNDWRGIREGGPNAMFEEYFVKVKVKNKECWEGRMGIWVLPANNGKRGDKGSAIGRGGIEKGDEICVSYGKGWWRARRGAMEDWGEDGQPEPESEN